MATRFGPSSTSLETSTLGPPVGPEGLNLPMMRIASPFLGSGFVTLPVRMVLPPVELHEVIVAVARPTGRGCRCAVVGGDTFGLEVPEQEPTRATTLTSATMNFLMDPPGPHA